ncbi:MAG TPA: methyltransferase domain-containing protein [Euzebya sp.]|nr:methyltransferase domain-containing protein [Euzebya sp.]
MTPDPPPAGRTVNPPAFEAAVDDYLAPYRQQFNHDAMRHTFLDNDRFHRWAALVDRLHPIRGARFLSSGCGMGGSLLAYHDAGAATVTGVEVDPLYVRLAGLRVQGVPGADVHAIDPDQPLPFADGAFDVIESMDVLEHVPDPPAYLAELVRVLVPDGTILLVTPNRLWPVEQHLGIAGPPWLPVGLADRLFTGLSRLPMLAEDRRFRYAKLHGMRTQNLSLRTLRRLARDAGLHLRLLQRDPDDDDFPLPADHPRAEALLGHRLGKFLAPVKTLAITLQRR